MHNRNVPTETIAEMQAAGFFKIVQPKRWGSYEMLPNVLFEVQKALAEGRMSTGWMYGAAGCRPYELAPFHDKAQVRDLPALALRLRGCQRHAGPGPAESLPVRSAA